MSVSAARGATGRDHALAPVLPVILGLAALACVGGIVRAALIVPLHLSLDPNEGWNAYHTAAAMAGHGLYPAPSEFMVNNYPPLSFYLVGGVGALLGDRIVAGRIVSLLSFFAVCGFVAAILRAFDASRRAALLATVFFAGILLIASDYVGMDDPQLLGHAFEIAAAFLLLRGDRNAAATCAAAVLFVAGGFVKHNLFVLPFASLAWLALFDRGNARRLAFCMALLALAGLAAFRAGFGFDLLGRLASAREWSLPQMWTGLAAWLPFAAVPLCALCALVVQRPRDPRVAFVALYAGVAIAAAAAMLGGAGVDANATFDADIALALAAGLALHRLLGQRGWISDMAAPAFALACLAPLPAFAPPDADWRTPSFWMHPLQAESAQAAGDIRFLRAQKGPAVCESLAWCYWAGKPASVDVFNVDQQLRTGARDPAQLLAFVRSRRFAAIELDETDPFPLPPPFKAAISENYRVARADDLATWLVPRPTRK